MSLVKGKHIAKEPADSVIIVGVVTKDLANITAVGFVLITDRVYKVADSLSSVTTVDLLEGNKDVNSLVICI